MRLATIIDFRTYLHLRVDGLRGLDFEQRGSARRRGFELGKMVRFGLGRQ